MTDASGMFVRLLSRLEIAADGCGTYAARARRLTHDVAQEFERGRGL